MNTSSENEIIPSITDGLESDETSLTPLESVRQYIANSINSISSNTERSVNNTQAQNVQNTISVEDESAAVGNLLDEESGEDIMDEQDQANVQVSQIEDDGVQISAAPSAAEGLEAELEFDADLFPQLGDRILIDSNKYGRIVGKIYYRDYDYIKIMPDGVSDRLYTFPLIQTDENGEEFDEELGVTAMYILEKRKLDSFVKQQNLREFMTIDTFTTGNDTHNKYIIEKVDVENDSIIIKDENNDTLTINFNYIGIPLDIPFEVIRIIDDKPKDVDEESDNQQIAEQPDEEVEDELEVSNEEKEEAEAGEEDFGIEVVGEVEIPEVDVYVAKPTYEQLYPDTLQKNDALNDFLRMLTMEEQKNPLAIRAMRILVETLFQLKQNSIQYNENGNIRGPSQTTVHTIAELINSVHIPLARPVLDVKKKLYDVKGAQKSELDELIANLGAETKSGENADSDYVYFRNFKNELYDMNKNVLGPVSTVDKPIFWETMQQNIKNYVDPWFSEAKVDPMWVALRDSEAFRMSIPDEENPEVDGYSSNNYEISKLDMSLIRELTTTYRKTDNIRKDFRKKVALYPPDSAHLKNYLLFPLSTSNALGTTRSGSIVIDSQRSQQPLETMKNIIHRLGGVKDVATSNDILAVGIDGNTLGNIKLSDYIETISIPSLGLGDAREHLYQIGLNDIELNKEILDIIEQKIIASQKQLISTLTVLREKMIEVTSEQVKKISEEDVKSVLDDMTLIDNNIKKEAILHDSLIEFEKNNKLIGKYDIAQVANLIQKFGDFFMIAAGGNSLLVAKERFSVFRKKFLEELYISKRIKNKELDVGHPPLPNPCEHVGKLSTIRRIKDDDSEFMQLLTKFFIKYQGLRQDNWINCIVCNKHLLCVHERLQIQGYINPKDKDNIQKEILINFSGGLFNGKYICKNCGQPISSLEYDTGLEYDDNGRPMMGRAVLSDKELIEQRNMDILLYSPELLIQQHDITEEDSQKEGGNEQEAQENQEIQDKQIDKETRQLYNSIFNEIANVIGFVLRGSDLHRVTEQLNLYISNTIKREQYDKQRKLLAEQKKPVPPVYDMYIAQNTIYAAAAILLVDIQTKIPNYTTTIIPTTIKNCKRSFGGYPLKENDIEYNGINYIACVLDFITTGTKTKKEPWSMTGFEKFPGDKKVEIFKKSILNIFAIIKKNNQSLSTTLDIQLLNKRKYIADNKSSDIKFNEIIPHTYLPEQPHIHSVDVAENNTDNQVIIPTVAEHNTSTLSQQLVSKYWIRLGNKIAKEMTLAIHGNPIIENVCCKNNINTPGVFWKNVPDLPHLKQKTLTPILNQPYLQVYYKPRPSTSILVEAPNELMYRIFLKICFTGKRRGYSHEVGLTNKCVWCGFQFPTKPTVMNTDTEGRDALMSQEVITDKKSFQELLDTVHIINKTSPYLPPEISSFENIMKKLAGVSVEPFQNWKLLILEILEQIKNYRTENGNDGISESAFVDIVSNYSIKLQNEKENVLFGKYEGQKRWELPPNVTKTLSDITKLSWMNFFQVLETYFIVPIQRILSGYNQTKYTDSSLGLSQPVMDDIDKILELDNKILATYSKKINDITSDDGKTFIKERMRECMMKLSAILSFKQIIRKISMKGGQRMLEYFQQGILYGALSSLFDYRINNNQLITGPIIKKITQFTFDFLKDTLEKFYKERLGFSDEELKERLQIRAELEKQEILRSKDVMTDEERKIDQKHMNIGINRWAVGNTAAIRKMNEQQYLREKEERQRAGIVDFAGIENLDGGVDMGDTMGEGAEGEGEGAGAEGGERDILGFGFMDEQINDAYERNYGYDHAQYGEDD